MREALELVEGTHVVFRVEGKKAVLARTPEFPSLAGIGLVASFDRSIDRVRSIERIEP